MTYPMTFMYGHPLIEKIVLWSDYARAYTTTGNVYQVKPDWGYKFTQDDLFKIVAEAIRKEKA